MTHYIYVDVETRNPECDLRDCGPYVYASHPLTDVWCVVFRRGEKVLKWVPGKEIPKVLWSKDCVYVAHNAAFERAIFNAVLSVKHGFPHIPIDQWRCSMVLAMTLGMPPSLDGVATALGLAQQKDKEGQTLMKAMAQYDDERAKAAKAEDIQRLIEYCDTDTKVTQAVHERLPHLTDNEQKIWELDQRINDRGVHIDTDLIRALRAKRDVVMEQMSDRIHYLTDGFVTAPTQAARLLLHVNEQTGSNYDSLDKAAIRSLMASDSVPYKIKELLKVRQMCAKTSVSKTDKMLQYKTSDGTVKGLFQYHGAATGRWAGRGPQFHNIPRPYGVCQDPAILRQVRSAFLAEDDKALHDFVSEDDTILDLASCCVRSCLMPKPGHKLCVADYASIEARVLAWMAGHTTLLADFYAGVDVYCKQASKIFGREITKADKDERQIGKVATLALGYQGGANAFYQMTKAYALDMEGLAGYVIETADDDTLAKAEYVTDMMYDESTAMSIDTWKACEIIKVKWREANKPIVDLWADVQSALMTCAKQDTKLLQVGQLVYTSYKRNVRCVLPSGRSLTYLGCRIGPQKTPWGDNIDSVWYSRSKSGSPLMRQTMYGGLGVENAAQAISRDLMASALLAAEQRGLETVLHVHDEIGIQSPAERADTDLQTLIGIMQNPPSWAGGLPVTAEGAVQDFYGK